MAGLGATGGRGTERSINGWAPWVTGGIRMEKYEEKIVKQEHFFRFLAYFPYFEKNRVGL
jgi:hypothetical protein